MDKLEKRHIYSCKKLASKLARTKAKFELLSCGVDIDLYSSLRVHVGKKFENDCLEEKKRMVLRSCQKELLSLSRMEVVASLKKHREDFRTFFERKDVQSLCFEDYKTLTNICHSHEAFLLANISRRHKRKISFFANQSANVSHSIVNFVVKPEKKIKHRETLKIRRREKQKRKRAKVTAGKKEKQKLELEKIKSSNLVLNFSNEDIPDEAYFYLALGSTFVPTKRHDKHDYMYDAKYFCRKLAWSYFYNKPQSDSESLDGNDLSSDTSLARNDNNYEEIDYWETPSSLRIKGKSFPDLQNKHFDLIMQKILCDVERMPLPKKQWSNLSDAEHIGLQWCQKAVRKKRLYFTRADKGGAMLILDAVLVNDIILSNLNNENKFAKLEKDPRGRIKNEIKQLTSQYEDVDLISRDDCFLISGQTANGGMSHSPSFCIGKPYTYPLFKIHKLSEEMILNKVTPPVRMVTSGVGGPTHRLGIFLDGILQPVVNKYCEGELVKDTTSFLAALLDLEANGSMSGCNLIGTLDVDALYPSIKIKYVQEAIRHALVSCTGYSMDHIDMIIKMVNLSINNAVVHYRGKWYSPKQGIPTGGSESGSIANIYVKWCLDQKILPSQQVKSLNKIEKRKRFLDDIWFLWRGSVRNFDCFLKAVNNVGIEFGITLKGEVSDMVNFLDVSTFLIGGSIRTCLYVKPTDAKRYLHRKSDHSLHTFRSIPYSQFRRVVILCSDIVDRDYFIHHMFAKFVDSGYVEEELCVARENALKINRMNVLRSVNDNSEISKRTSNTNDSLTFVINHDKEASAHIRKIVHENQEMINVLFGKEIRVMIAERRNPNTGSLLFAKSGFARELCDNKATQKCNSRGCLTCSNMNIEKKVCINGLPITLDFSLDCGTENVIYLFVCKWCGINEFYFGQTINCLRDRSNGHRSAFHKDKYKKSALSYHIWDKHREHFSQKLNNFNVGVVRTALPKDLERLEDFYVVKTEANLVGLNRYKVLM